jgi:hypothetical protein
MRTFYETIKTSSPKVSFSIKLAASAVSGWAEPLNAEP